MRASLDAAQPPRRRAKVAEWVLPNRFLDRIDAMTDDRQQILNAALRTGAISFALVLAYGLTSTDEAFTWFISAIVVGLVAAGARAMLMLDASPKVIDLAAYEARTEQLGNSVQRLLPHADDSDRVIDLTDPEPAAPAKV